MAFKKLVILALSLTLISCKSGTPESEQNPEGAISFEKISKEFNPRVEETKIGIFGIQRISMNLFGFTDDVRLQYTPHIDPHTATIQTYTVSKNARYPLRGINTQIQGATILLGKNGAYECALQTDNDTITELEGSCYVRVIVTLPFNSEVEVFNVNQKL